MKRDFADVVRDAVADLTLHGFDNPYRLQSWLSRLREAASGQMDSDAAIVAHLRRSLGSDLDRALSQYRLERTHPGVSGWTIERIRPDLRAELDRRILASADLIKINRDRAIEQTLQRFSGWSTSIPAGGSSVVDRNEVKAHIAAPVKKSSYEARRVAIDQGHKLVASINEVIANQTGAIAAMWRSHGKHDKHYDARPEHLKRDGKLFAIRGNWALEKGLMKKGAGYTDQIERVGELPYCRCYYVYLRNLRDLPDTMLTARGRFALQETKAA